MPLDSFREGNIKWQQQNQNVYQKNVNYPTVNFWDIGEQYERVCR
jgi:hypothetical protein